MANFESRRKAFGNRLREIRENAGLSGTDLANKLGWKQPKVSKIERGRQTATDADVVAWLEAAAVPARMIEQMRAELRDVQVAQLAWRRQLREGHVDRQQQGVRDTQDATVIRAIDTMAVPGLLQTPDYAHAIFRSQADLLDVPDDDIDDAVAARMARQQVLYDRSKHVEVLLAEAALSHPVCSRQELLGQLDRLVAVVGLPHVRFGVLPAYRTVPHLLPHGFWIVDDQVRYETVSGEHHVTDPDEVALFTRLADRLWEAAVEGERARELLLTVLERVRGQQ